ncbi:MAG TPA: serine hydrolase [Nanoarchaeota archaeon]|nr:serine hydrolase [Candidatus Woesearchaeota archaeon]HIH15642.1 serine hydrolase [Nanoarchaeota archaeon]HIH58459.1 serine hydrolase [Nanoarchaeota archaeon]HII13610.1 serine hydrolase [Nanoarchaeota archaeon]HIJ04527.1 serine hydrolase [Nanoarchaeota archaeon]
MVTRTQRKNIRRAQKLHTVANAAGPYVLANVAVAAVLDYCFENKNILASQPDWLQTLEFYTALGAFNLGALVPIVREGPVNYVGQFFDRKRDKGITLHPYVKSALLTGTLVFGLSDDSLRGSSYNALERIFTDGRSLFEKDSGIKKPVKDSVDDSVKDPIDEAPKEDPKKVRPLPIALPDGEQGNQKLEEDITSYVNVLRTRGLARVRGIEDYSLFAKDLRSGKVFLDINTHTPRLAASTNKMYVLLAAEHEVYAGRLSHTSQLERNLIGMIRSSNNNSTDWVIDQVGGEARVNEIIQEYGFEDTVVEKINQSVTGGRTLGNKTSSEDLAELLERLYKGDLPRSDQMREILSLKANGHADRIFDKTCIPGTAAFLKTNGGYIDTVEDKTGFLWGANTDAGLVTAHFYNKNQDQKFTVPYVVAFMIEDENAKPDGFRGNANAWGRAKSETMRSISEGVFWTLEGNYSDIASSCKTHNGVHPQ